MKLKLLPEEISDLISEYSDDMKGENWIFNTKKEDWDSYTDKLELYMEVKNVADNKNTAHLLTNIEMDM